MFTFSYNVTRPYPLRFFTAIIIVLFLIATIFLSFFNTIVTGYDLRVTYSTNPNATIARKMWYDKPVFKGIRKLSPSCEPKEIGVQQKFNTNKNGFIYSIDSITTMDQDGLLVPSPSMRYLNNTLENCTINYIKIEMAKELGRTAQQVAWSRWGPQLLAAISCFITNEQGHTQFDFTTDYDLIPPNANKRYDLTGGGRDQWAFAAQQKLYQFVVSNNTQNPAMWWAESLMSYGWLDASFKIEAADSAMKGDGKWQSGSINFRPNPDESSIFAPDFFNITYYTLQANGAIFWSGTEVRLDASSSDPLYAMLNACDLLAKSFYSAVATDIGRTHGPNILTDESVLQTVTSNYSEIAKTFRLVAAGPATDSYDALKSTIGQPMITPSTIFTSYLCQTPEKKLISALVVSVLLANLVLLRALWSIVTMAATYLVNLRNPKANYCIGCGDYDATILPGRSSFTAKTAVASHRLLGDQDHER